MASKDIVLITGANKGIGYEAIKALINTDTPYHILLGSRDTSRGEEAVETLSQGVPNTKSTIEVVQIEVTDDQSVKKAVDYIQNKHGRIDVLVNNAGANLDRNFHDDCDQRLRALWNENYDVNTSSAMVVTYSCVPLLLASSHPRLLFTTSGFASLKANADKFQPAFAPNPPSGWPKPNIYMSLAYRASKAAMNMLAIQWHWLLREDGVKTWAIDPGFLATNLAGYEPEELLKKGAQPAWKGGDLIRRIIQGERDADVGKFVAGDGVVLDF